MRTHFMLKIVNIVILLYIMEGGKKKIEFLGTCVLSSDPPPLSPLRGQKVDFVRLFFIHIHIEPECTKVEEEG